MPGRGNKHAFRLKTGEDRLGWVRAVEPRSILFAWAPSPFYAQAMGTDQMAPPPETIPMEGIDTASLLYWDEAADRWLPFEYF